MSLLQQAYDFFIGQGASPSAAAGISSGLFAESQLNPSNINPSSGAYGIGQWLGGRQQALFNQYGSQPSFTDQLQFVWEELTGQAGDNAVTQGQSSSILNAISPQSALSSFITGFERPKAGYETTSDISRGTNALGQISMTTQAQQNFATGFQDILSNPLGAAQTAWGQLTSNPFGYGASVISQGIQNTAGVGVQTVADATGLGPALQSIGQGIQSAAKGISGADSWLQGLTSKDTVTRVAVGVVAIILLLAGIFFLAGNRSNTINVSGLAKLKGAV